MIIESLNQPIKVKVNQSIFNVRTSIHSILFSREMQKGEIKDSYCMYMDMTHITTRIRSNRQAPGRYAWGGGP